MAVDRRPSYTEAAGLRIPGQVVYHFFFFQAEDGIRDYKVTGVQTCALPILQPLEPVPAKAEFWSAGGPLYSTARDYMVFLQMLLNGGSFNGARILKPETVALMNKNHTGNIPCGVLKTAMPALSNDVNFFPGADIRWGLGYMMNLQPGPNGRSAGTFSWGGLYNTYYWLDPAKKVAGLIMTQILPFADPRAVSLYGQLEAAVYETLKSA